MDVFVNISPPANWQDFEKFMCVLFECILKNKAVKMHGRIGQKQHGVDIYGLDFSNGKSEILVGVQCKGKNKNFGKKITKKELYNEVEKAKKFNPGISEFYLVTTAQKDAVIEKIALEITIKNIQDRNGFTVEVWGWEDIEMQLQRESNKKAWKELDTNYKAVEVIESIESLGHDFKKGHEEILSRLENPSLEKIKIEMYRNLIEKGKVLTAHEGLEELEKELSNNVSLDDKAKILALKARCKHDLDELQDSANLFLKAYELCPNAEKADIRKILALILQGKGEEAVKFGLDSMASTKNKKLLCTHIIHAKISCKEKEESPFGFIPEDVEEDENIAIAKINYLRNKGDIKWQKLASDAYSKYPDDEDVMRLYARSLIEEVDIKFHESNGQAINSNSAVKLDEAIEILNRIYTRLKSSELAWKSDHIHIAYNLANAYILNNDIESAQQIFEEAMKHNPNNKFLAAGIFVVACRKNDLALMKELIPILPEEENTIIGKMQFFINSEQWDDVKNMPEINGINGLSKENKAFYEMGKAFADWQLDNNIDIKEIVEKIERKYPKEIIIPIISHQMAIQKNDVAWRKECYHRALDRIEQMPAISQPMFINIALVENDFKTIISILDGNVDYNNDNDNLRILALSYVNMPPQKSSKYFINKLSDELKDNSYYAGVIGAIENKRGNLSAAEFYLRKSLNANPSDLQFQLGLINTLARDNRDDDIKAHLETINLSTLLGNALEKMQMASIFIQYSEVKKGLEYAYKTTVDNYDSAEIVSAYPSVFLLNPDKERKEIETVQMNTCVEFLYNGETRVQRVFIEHESNQYLNRGMDSNVAANFFIGKNKGEAFTIKNHIGTPEKIEIIDIFDTPTGLFREILQRPQSFYSNEPNLYKYELEENDGVPDFEPLLEDIKNISKDKEKFKNSIIDLYLNDPYPLSMLAKNANLDILLVAGLIKSEGYFIKSCTGFFDEREKAFKLCESALKTGIVLDTYTAIVAYECGILPILKLIFSKIIIPQSTMDELNSLKNKINSMGDGFMGYKNGQHFLSEITSEDKSKEVSLYKNMIDDFKNTFDICPSDFPNSPNDLELEICKGSSHILDSGHLCVANKIPILSDDMHYRELINHLYQVEGFWLQIPLSIALQKGYIDINIYAKSLAKLAEYRHSHIFLNIQTLIAACTLDEEKLESFVYLMEFIYCPDADIYSHTIVLLEFMDILWRNKSILEIRKKKATGLIIEKFGSVAQSNNNFKKMIEPLLSHPRIKNNERLYNYIIGWLEGHFINI